MAFGKSAMAGFGDGVKHYVHTEVKRLLGFEVMKQHELSVKEMVHVTFLLGPCQDFTLT